MLYQKRASLLLIIISLLGFHSFTYSETTNAPSLISLFPLENYPQRFSAWLKPDELTNHQSLLTPQHHQRHYKKLLNHYFGTESPWDPSFVRKVLKRPNLYDDLHYSQPRNLYAVVTAGLQAYRNDETKAPEKIVYGLNFRPHPSAWFDRLEYNMDAEQFKEPLDYNPEQRAIATDNLQGRTLPTDAVCFLDHKIAGEGYPFDLLQASTIWAGTPLYILGETRDRAWSLVRSPRFVAWVKSTHIARVDENFIKRWTQSSRFLAITRTETPIIDSQFKRFRFLGHIGLLLPQLSNNTSTHVLKALIPIRSAKGQAMLAQTEISPEDATPMPLTPTVPAFQKIIEQVIGRPYGWGGMYFYNDCASELKNLLTPFGIWLPINSRNQADPRQALGRAHDLSELDQDTRLLQLIKEGKPFMTLIYINGHVMLYLGTYPDPTNANQLVPLTYQSLWGLRPTTPPDRRAIIGQTLLFPLLKSYPEAPELSSLVAKPVFKLLDLTQLPEIEKPSENKSKAS